VSGRRLPWHRRRPGSSEGTGVEPARRAELLDNALTSWQTGEHPDAPEFDDALEAVEPVGDALAAAQALDALGTTEPLPAEPLVTLRAALAARAADPLPAWRRALAQPRLAPALAAIVAVVVAVGALTTVRTTDEALTHVAAARAEAFLETAQDRLAFIEAQTATATTAGELAVDPAELNDAIVEAQAAAASARAAAQLAPAEERKTLLAQVELQQRQINALRNKVLILAGASGLVPDDAGAVAATSTTTTVRASTTTEAPTTTTTVKPTTTTLRPTTTTAAPTTTTTDPAPTTTAPDDTTTTTVADIPRDKSEGDVEPERLP
jgi:hypothetical protein